jgi:triacylglycerol lipase
MELPPGFDKAVALEAASLVNRAYDQYQDFVKHTPWSLPADYENLGVLAAKPDVWFARKEPFGFVARNKATRDLFVTFRGTESLEDWLTDFTFPQEAHPWGKVEDGFAHVYNQCSADVHTFVQAGATPGAQSPANVIVTGHSLGGALATLATADLVRSGASPQAVMYTFASPRVGDRPFAREFDNRVLQRWRVANTEDIVPNLPLATVTLLHPRSIFGLRLILARSFEYQHVGIPLSFTTHHGSIPANHAMQVYVDAVRAA